MKFQIPNIHHSIVNRRTHAHTDRQAESNMPFQLFQSWGHKLTDVHTHTQTDKPKAICPSNFFKVGGIIIIMIIERPHQKTNNKLNWSETFCQNLL